MPRRLRIEYEGAIHHVMSRGNARQNIVHDDDDRHRLIDDLERTVIRSGWELLAFVVLSNHLHLLVKTPQPNLARGMQVFLSAYAHWSQRRRGRPGHLLQGRYKAELVEDESYYWTVSRYIHLNPVRAGLATHPAAWRWSSYPGYADGSQRRSWVGYDTLLGAWQGEFGGKGAGTAYWRFVEAGVAEPPASPFQEAFGGWVLGSARFVERVRALAGPVVADPAAPEARALAGLSVDAVLAAVARHYGVADSELSRRHGAMEARATAARLCRRYTEVPQRELAPRLGLSSAASVPNLTRWLDAQLATRPELSSELSAITRSMGSASPDRRAPTAKGQCVNEVMEQDRKQKT